MSNNSITVLILTYNEEKNIEHTLNNVKNFADEVVILDSYSTDQTINIAKEFGAKVHFRKFDDFSSQRKYALNSLPLSGDWIFVLDADEILTEELKQEILTELPATQLDAFIIKRRFYWQGKWIKRGYYPTELLRLGRKGKIDCDNRPINEHIICTTRKVGCLKYDLIDYNRNDLSSWITKHNSYSTREALQLIYNDNTRYNFWGSQYERKRWIRSNIWNNLPPVIRPFLYFIYRYVLKGGFLDGKKAFVYHFLHAFIYRILIDFKYLEIKWSNKKKKK
jgi:glycosyltransferase involved in cell wall biosynthesis